MAGRNGSVGRIDRDAVLAAAGPELEALKAEARSAVSSLKRLFAFGALMPILMFATMVGFAFGIRIVPAVVVFPAFVAFVVVLVVLALQAAKRIFKARSRVMKALAPALGLSFAPRPPEPIDLSVFEGTYYGSLFKYSRSQDVLSGERAGAAFEIFDAALTGRSKGPDGKWRAGQPPKWLEGIAFNLTRVVRVEVPGRWTSRTVIIKDFGLVNRFYQPEGMERVRLVDPAFEKLFEVFSTDQTEARAFLSPVIMERLLGLEDLFETKRRRNEEDAPPPAVGVFADGAFMLAFPFAQVRDDDDVLSKIKLTAVDDMVVDLILKELDAVLGVVDAVAGPEAPAAP
jgi:hypothetical protein